jgi:hypothetical protein
MDNEHNQPAGFQPAPSSELPVPNGEGEGALVVYQQDNQLNDQLNQIAQMAITDVGDAAEAANQLTRSQTQQLSPEAKQLILALIKSNEAVQTIVAQTHTLVIDTHEAAVAAETAAVGAKQEAIKTKGLVSEIIAMGAGMKKVIENLSHRVEDMAKQMNIHPEQDSTMAIITKKIMYFFSIMVKMVSFICQTQVWYLNCGRFPSLPILSRINVFLLLLVELWVIYGTLETYLMTIYAMSKDDAEQCIIAGGAYFGELVIRLATSIGRLEMFTTPLSISYKILAKLAGLPQLDKLCETLNNWFSQTTTFLSNYLLELMTKAAQMGFSAATIGVTTVTEGAKTVLTDVASGASVVLTAAAEGGIKIAKKSAEFIAKTAGGKIVEGFTLLAPSVSSLVNSLTFRRPSLQQIEIGQSGIKTAEQSIIEQAVENAKQAGLKKSDSIGTLRTLGKRGKLPSNNAVGLFDSERQVTVRENTAWQVELDKINKIYQNTQKIIYTVYNTINSVIELPSNYFKSLYPLLKTSNFFIMSFDNLFPTVKTADITSPSFRTPRSSPERRYQRENITDSPSSASFKTPRSSPERGFQEANITDQGFQPANITDQGFQPANITDQGFQPANITDQGFQPANITDQEFQPANITDQGFQPANITDQGFQPANITANITDQGFQQVNVTAQRLQEELIKEAVDAGIYAKSTSRDALLKSREYKSDSSSHSKVDVDRAVQLAKSAEEAADETLKKLASFVEDESYAKEIVNKRIKEIEEDKLEKARRLLDHKAAQWTPLWGPGSVGYDAAQEKERKKAEERKERQQERARKEEEKKREKKRKEEEQKRKDEEYRKLVYKDKPKSRSSWSFLGGMNEDGKEDGQENSIMDIHTSNLFLFKPILFSYDLLSLLLLASCNEIEVSPDSVKEYFDLFIDYQTIVYKVVKSKLPKNNTRRNVKQAKYTLRIKNNPKRNKTRNSRSPSNKRRNTRSRPKPLRSTRNKLRPKARTHSRNRSMIPSFLPPPLTTTRPY